MDDQAAAKPDVVRDRDAGGTTSSDAPRSESAAPAAPAARRDETLMQMLDRQRREQGQAELKDLLKKPELEKDRELEL